MNISRREFLKQSGLAAGAGLSLSHGALGPAAVPSSRLSDLWQRDLVQALSQLGRRACLQGGCLAPCAGNSVLPMVDLLVEIKDLDALQVFYESEILKAFPQVIANGNSLHFEQDGVFYTVEALLPDQYAERLDSLRLGSVDFAHEALTGPLSGGSSVSDPLNALSNVRGGGVGLRLVNTPATGNPDAFGLLVKALIERGCHSLHTSDELALFLQLLLRRTPVSEQEAEAVVAAVIGHISVLSRLMPQEEILGLLGSKLVTHACERIRSLPWTTVKALFTSLRERLPVDFTDGSVWLAILLSPELRQGIILPQILTDLELAEIATRQDLPLAKAALKQPAAPAIWQAMREKATTYEDWRRLCFGPAVGATLPHEDFDGDGTANVFEFATNSDPADASQDGAVKGDRVIENGVTYMVLNYVEDRGKANIRYEVQGSESLISPAWSAEGIEDVVTGSADNWVYHQGRVPSNGAIRYLRLAVSADIP